MSEKRMTYVSFIYDLLSGCYLEESLALFTTHAHCDSDVVLCYEPFSAS